MFGISASVLDIAGRPGELKGTRATFPIRSDAVAYLDRLIANQMPNGGYEPDAGYWWVRANRKVTRYTIDAAKFP